MSQLRIKALELLGLIDADLALLQKTRDALGELQTSVKSTRSALETLLQDPALKGQDAPAGADEVPWCEPCQHWHRLTEPHSVDVGKPKLRVRFKAGGAHLHDRILEVLFDENGASATEIAEIISHSRENVELMLTELNKEDRVRYDSAAEVWALSGEEAARLKKLRKK